MAKTINLMLCVFDCNFEKFKMVGYKRERKEPCRGRGEIWRRPHRTRDLGAKASSGQTEGDLGASGPSTSQMPVLPPKRDPTASCSATHSATQHWPTEHKGPAQRSGEREQE